MGSLGVWLCKIYYRNILPLARRSVFVIPRPDAESRKHPGLQTMLAAFTGFRVEARNDDYRELRLLFVACACHFYISYTQTADEPKTRLMGSRVVSVADAKGGLWPCQRRSLALLKTVFCKAICGLLQRCL